MVRLWLIPPCLGCLQGFQRLCGILNELVDERRLAANELRDFLFRKPPSCQRSYKGPAFALCLKHSIMEKKEVQLRRVEGVQMLLEGRNEETDVLKSPPATTKWAADSRLSRIDVGFPLVAIRAAAFPPYLAVTAGGDIFRS